MKRFSELKRRADINGNKLNHYVPILKVILLAASKLLRSDKCLRENKTTPLHNPEFKVVLKLM
jgi:hypothetical protein